MLFIISAPGEPFLAIDDWNTHEPVLGFLGKQFISPAVETYSVWKRCVGENLRAKSRRATLLVPYEVELEFYFVAPHMSA